MWDTGHIYLWDLGGIAAQIPQKIGVPVAG
jgi:hypothetical protein